MKMAAAWRQQHGVIWQAAGVKIAKAAAWHRYLAKTWLVMESVGKSKRQHAA